jgi:hypothetical protein
MWAFSGYELYERRRIDVENRKIISLKPLATDDRAKAFMISTMGRSVGMLAIGDR